MGKLNCSNFKLDVHNDQIRSHCTQYFRARNEPAAKFYNHRNHIRKLFTFILLIFHVSKYLQETLARKICLMFERSCVYKSFELMIYLCCSLRRKIWKRTCFWGKWWIPCFFYNSWIYIKKLTEKEDMSWLLLCNTRDFQPGQFQPSLQNSRHDLFRDWNLAGCLDMGISWYF